MSSSGKLFALLAALLLAAATGLGALTSHGLADRLDEQALATVATAVEYQFYQGLGLLAIALFCDRLSGASIRAAGWLMFAGAVLFCGGIYADHLLGLPRAAALTPVGGSAMIASWLVLAFAVLTSPSRQ